MNPDPAALAYQARRNERERAARAARQNELHRRALARRRKAKNGGPR